MISTLHGILFEKTPGSVIIECGGVGYEATIPLGAYNELPPVGSECRIFVRHVVREDDEQLGPEWDSPETSMLLAGLHSGLSKPGCRKKAGVGGGARTAIGGNS